MAHRLDVEQFYDMHTLLWDADVGQTLDVRNDALESAVSYESSRVPEAHLSNEFAFENDATATLDQDVLMAVDTASLLMRSRAVFDRPARRTLYTVFVLGIHDGAGTDDVEEASVIHEHGYEQLCPEDVLSRGNRLDS